jgi:transposase InsO family protein
MIRVPLADRFFWVWLYRIWPRALDVMVLVKPKTVISWHYAGFRLIHQMKRDNPTWGVRRIEGELRKLGFDISYMAVYKCLPKQFTSPSPGWRTFLQNHMKETAAVDLLVVVTLTFQLIYAMVLISHGRRKILHIAVTEHPTQDWMTAQITRAFSANPKPKYLLRDRDAIYGRKFRDRLKELRIKEQLTTRQSPWQNIYVERVICSIRRECLDHVIVLNERHLK